MNIGLIQKIFKQIDTIPDEVLMMSRYDCHMVGLDSIVIGNSLGRLTRIFFTRKHHRMYANMPTPDGKFGLGVHDHKYSLKLTGLYGNVININLQRETFYETVNAVDQYDVVSDFENGTKFELINQYANLSTIGTKLLDQEPLDLPHNILHTVFVPEGECAAWMVEEGFTEKECTALYNNTEPSTECCYTKFSNADQVRQYLRNTLTFKE